MIAWVAGEVAANPNWTGWAPVIIAATVTGGLGMVGGIWLKRMNRHVDDATVLKTHVEAEKMRAETDKMRVETDKTRVESEGREVEIARGLLDDIRKELDRYRAEMERDREKYNRQLGELTETNDKRFASVNEQLTAVQNEQQSMRELIEEHLPWDAQAHEVAQQHRPDLGPPPPLGDKPKP